MLFEQGWILIMDILLWLLGDTKVFARAFSDDLTVETE